MTDLERMLLTYLKNSREEGELAPIIQDYMYEHKITDDTFSEYKVYWMMFTSLTSPDPELLPKPNVNTFNTQLERSVFCDGLWAWHEYCLQNSNLAINPILILGYTKEEYKQCLKQEVEAVLEQEPY